MEYRDGGLCAGAGGTYGRNLLMRIQLRRWVGQNYDDYTVIVYVCVILCISVL